MTPEQQLHLCNLLSRGVPMAEARKIVGLEALAPAKLPKGASDLVHRTPAKKVEEPLDEPAAAKGLL